MANSVNLPHLVPVVGDWDTVLNNEAARRTPFEDLMRAEAKDDWDNARQKADKKRQKILDWIQNFISEHPEGIIDNTFALAQPTIEPLPLDNKEEFPALPPPKPTPPAPKTISKKSKKKVTNKPESPIKQTAASIQKNSAQGHDTTNLGNTDRNLSSSRAASSPKNGNSNSTTPASQPQIQTTAWTPWSENPWEHPWGRPLKPWTADPNSPVLSPLPPKSLGGSTADNTVELAEQQALLNQEILDTSHGPWKDCLCDQCYDENKKEYEKHMAECEDCREEYFNHEMFDGRLSEFWERLERKFCNEEICKLCRWRRDLGQHPLYRGVEKG